MAIFHKVHETKYYIFAWGKEKGGHMIFFDKVPIINIV